MPAIANPSNRQAVLKNQRRRGFRWISSLVALGAAIPAFIWLVGLAEELLGDAMVATVFILIAVLHVVIIVVRLLGRSRPGKNRY